jgi:hypothetical protein
MVRKEVRNAEVAPWACGIIIRVEEGYIERTDYDSQHSQAPL